MRTIKLVLLFLLVLSLVLTGSWLPVWGSLSSRGSSFQPEQVSQALDRDDIAGAIRLVEQGWKQQYEDYYQGQLTSELLEIAGIAHSLDRISRATGKKSALIYAIPTPAQLELVLIPPTAAPRHRRITEANQQVLLDTVGVFRRGVTNPSRSSQDYLPAAQKLYQWLIAPLESELRTQGINNLIFCLGTGLRSVPLAALHDGQRFLVQKYSLGIIPAFNLLDKNPAILRGTRVLAMGASQFQELPSLPAVPLELAVITKNLWQGKVLLNQDFTLEKLKTERGKYPYGIIHLATHAEFKPGTVENSYIQFWQKPLRLNQLKTLGLRTPVVQLLVLSACRTALGNPQAELGFAGLAVESGSKAVVASLWTVSDAGTLVLMSEFYRQLKTAPIKTEALRQAQIAMLQGQAYLHTSQAIRASSGGLPLDLQSFENVKLSHPYYWAAFTTIGNPW